MKYGICVECKVRNNDALEKELHQCPYCGREFCVNHQNPKPVCIPKFGVIVKNKELEAVFRKESEIEGKHPCFQYTFQRFREEKLEEEKQRQLRKEASDRMMDYYKKAGVSHLEEELKEEIERISPDLKQLAPPKQLRLGECPECGSTDNKIREYDAKTISYICDSCNHMWTQSKAPPHKIIEMFPRVEPAKTGEPAVITKKVGTEKLIAVALVCIIIGIGITSWVLLPNIKGLETKCSQLTQEIETITQEKVALETNLNALQTSFDDLQLEHAKLVSVYNSLNANYDSLQKEHEILLLEYESIYRSRYEEGYEEGYTQGLTEKGYNVVDPTYEEALDFIRSDRTDKNRYVEGEYVCWNFVADFKNNAFEAGYRCGFVYIEFRDGGHGIVCFNTTDRGLIFVEPQDDDLVALTVGEHYWDRSKYEVTYDDTIIRFGIIW